MLRRWLLVVGCPGGLWAPLVAGKKLYLRDQDQLFCYDIAAR
jgi:hypothetical protein